MSIETHPDDKVTWADEQQDEREALYKEYALPHESHEHFCNRMYHQLGENWVSRLTTTKHYKR